MEFILNKFVTVAGGLALAAVFSVEAFAGGFGRVPADTDILFEDGLVSVRGGVFYFDPNRQFENNQVPGLRGTEYSKPEVLPWAAAKYSVTDEFRCAATYTRPYSADSEYDVMNNRGKLSEKFEVDEYGATCAVFMSAGPGNVFVLGGVFLEDFSYDFDGFTRSPFGGITPLNFDLGSTEFGYRVGVGYEIPEMAFRAQLLYRSGTEHDADGDANLPAFGVTMPAFGQGELPQSVELRVQSGIAEDWLAYGSVKWVDWSVLDTLDVQIGPSSFSNLYHWRDGWTISGGVAHKFNESFTGLVGVSWDRGVSTGFDLMGDTIGVNAAISYRDQWGGDLRFSGAILHNEAVEETGYAPGTNSSSKATNGFLLSLTYKKNF